MNIEQWTSSPLCRLYNRAQVAGDFNIKFKFNHALSIRPAAISIRSRISGANLCPCYGPLFSCRLITYWPARSMLTHLAFQAQRPEISKKFETRIANRPSTFFPRASGFAREIKEKEDHNMGALRPCYGPLFPARAK